MAAAALARLAALLPPWLTPDAVTRAFGWGVCASYVMAFGSFYPQIGGMLGPVRAALFLRLSLFSLAPSLRQRRATRLTFCCCCATRAGRRAADPVAHPAPYDSAAAALAAPARPRRKNTSNSPPLLLTL